METFNPAKITPNASLNRVVITHIPWLSDDLWGKDGYELLGRPVLLQRVLETFPSLQATPDPILPFEELCRQGNPDALTLATDYGHRLASLIATLHEASDLSRQARPDWDESYWVYWKQVDRFILGGGLMSGHLGRHVFKIAGQLLGDRVQLSLAENPKYLSLIGCAVERMSNDKTRVLIDCGSTSIKSGLASYENGYLKTITLQAGIPTPSDPSAEALLEAIVEAISRCFQDAPDKESFSSEIPISVASYIDEKGQPERRGFVGQLYDLGSDIPALISQEVRRKVFNQEQVYVVLSHDGRASARSFAGSSHTTTIILGSALSFGIPPISRKSIIPASDDFALKMT